MKLAKSPPEVLPTQIPTRPFLRSLSWLTVRQGSVASPTKTLTFRAGDNHARMEPSVRSGTGVTGFSSSPGGLLAASATDEWDGRCKARAKDPCLVFSLEVERTEVDRVVGRAIDAMKRHTDEARALNVLAFHIQLDGAVGEFDSRRVRGPFAFSFAQMNTLFGRRR